MLYKTFQPHADLKHLVKFYWTLEVPFDPNNVAQKIIPDGCIEMTFNFGDGIKRYISEDEYVVHPSSMVMGQRTQSFLIEPLGHVSSFAICFYPHGFANFVNIPLQDLINAEVSIEKIFKSDEAQDLEHKMFNATDNAQRVEIIESFLLNQLSQTSTINNIVKSTVDSIIATKGSKSIGSILDERISERRKLERYFKNQIGLSPKQLGKILRLHAALKMMLEDEPQSLTSIAVCENEYFDQAHFNKDFKEFT
ncbi:MAG: helix-turn-helix domain-containing protein [Saprospiraceae bacterium]